MQPDQARIDWLEARRKGIGSSDVAGVCGLSKWMTPLQVYLDKIGELPPIEQSDEMEWGLRLEAAIAQAYQDKTGATVLMPEEHLYKSASRGWMLATPDRFAVQNGQRRILELKTASRDENWGEPWSDDIPEPYMLQVQHQMDVIGVGEADVAVLIAGSQFRPYRVFRCQQLIDQLRVIEGEFWQRVVDRDQPPVDFEHPSTPRLLRNLYRLDEATEIQLGPEAQDLAQSWIHARQLVKEYEDFSKAKRSQLQCLLGHAAIGHLPAGGRLVRKKVKRTAYEVAPTEFETFRIMGISKEQLHDAGNGQKARPGVGTEGVA